MMLSFSDTNWISRVILVDDDALTNMLNKKIIQSINPNIPVSTFIEVDKALAYLKETDEEGDALIFLDINFPIKNGWDFLDEYRQFTTRSSVILLSSSIDILERNKSKAYSGVIDYVSKPLSIEYVTNLLHINEPISNGKDC
jgi:response regulator of citrate/malate metabolism